MAHPNYAVKLHMARSICFLSFINFIYCMESSIILYKCICMSDTLQVMRHLFVQTINYQGGMVLDQ